VPFWDYLDVIGMNSYWTLGQDHNVTVDQIKANWQDIQKGPTGIFDFLAQQKKPVILLEAGSWKPSKRAIAPTPAANSANPTSANRQARRLGSFLPRPRRPGLHRPARPGRLTQLVFDDTCGKPTTMNPASSAANGSSASPAKVAARGAMPSTPSCPPGEIEVRVKAGGAQHVAHAAVHAGRA
jgi:hypothetical protein